MSLTLFIGFTVISANTLVLISVAIVTASHAYLHTTQVANPYSVLLFGATPYVETDLSEFFVQWITRVLAHLLLCWFLDVLASDSLDHTAIQAANAGAAAA